MIENMDKSELINTNISGTLAVLGIDIVSFSTLHDDDQIQSMRYLIEWIKESLTYQSINKQGYRWSSAGDGGYLTFTNNTDSWKAIDVAFSILDKIKRPIWIPRNGEHISLRMSLHAGTVQEGEEFENGTNIWGNGINTAARLLSVSLPSQLLVSKQYYDTYLKEQRTGEFELGEVHWRTVKHGIQVEVMNIYRDNIGLNENQASTKRWRDIGGLWHKTVSEYKNLINDTMRSGDPVAAIAAGKFLLDLEEENSVWDLCRMLSNSLEKPSIGYPTQYHSIFSQMPPDILMKVIKCIIPRNLKKDEVICKEGDPSNSSFFPVSGDIVVDVPGINEPISIDKGEIIGEFSLWIPNLPRTAKVRVIGEGLLLEIHNRNFKEILEGSSNVANSVFGIIKNRILENTLNSDILFPKVVLKLKESLSSIQAECIKYSSGDELDLNNSTYILFSGKVRLKPSDGRHIDLIGKGNFRNQPVIGITSMIGNPDGKFAEVLEDSVAVKIDHKTLKELQEKFILVRDAWNSLCGKRLGEIKAAELIREE